MKAKLTLAILAIFAAFLTSCADTSSIIAKKSVSHVGLHQEIDHAAFRTDLPVSSQVARIPASTLQHKVREHVETPRRAIAVGVPKREVIKRAIFVRGPAKAAEARKKIAVQKQSLQASNSTAHSPEKIPTKVKDVQAKRSEDPSASKQIATPFEQSYAAKATLSLKSAYDWCLIPARRLISKFHGRSPDIDEVQRLMQSIHEYQYVDLHNWIPKLPNSKKITEVVNAKNRSRNCLAKTFLLADKMKASNLKVIIGDHYTRPDPQCNFARSIGIKTCHAWLEWRHHDRGYILDCSLSTAPLPIESQMAKDYIPYYKADQHTTTALGQLKTKRQLARNQGPKLAAR